MVRRRARPAPRAGGGRYRMKWLLGRSARPINRHKWRCSLRPVHSAGEKLARAVQRRAAHCESFMVYWLYAFLAAPSKGLLGQILQAASPISAESQGSGPPGKAHWRDCTGFTEASVLGESRAANHFLSKAITARVEAHAVFDDHLWAGLMRPRRRKGPLSSAPCSG
jgi:hypothetical protein